MKVLFIAAIATTLSAPAWAINKCTGPDGKVVIQDLPCQAGKTESIVVHSGLAAAPPLERRPVAAPPVQQPAPQPSADSSGTPQKTEIEIEAEQCLNWYRPILRDPAGAYYRSPSKDRNVLTITIHATNGFGGYTTKPAACEFVTGRVDEGWTKIHAKRAGWPVN